MFVCVYFCGHFFTYMFTTHITNEGLNLLISAQHSWSLSIGGSLTCINYCNMGHSFSSQLGVFSRTWDLHICAEALYTFYTIYASWFSREFFPRECIFPKMQGTDYYYFFFLAWMCQLFHDFDTLAKIAINDACRINPDTVYSLLAKYCFHMTYWLHTFKWQN